VSESATPAASAMRFLRVDGVVHLQHLGGDGDEQRDSDTLDRALRHEEHGG
jgi:hypothetical protein